MASLPRGHLESRPETTGRAAGPCGKGILYGRAAQLPGGHGQSSPWRGSPESPHSPGCPEERNVRGILTPKE